MIKYLLLFLSIKTVTSAPLRFEPFDDELARQELSRERIVDGPGKRLFQVKNLPVEDILEMEDQARLSSAHPRYHKIEFKLNPDDETVEFALRKNFNNYGVYAGSDAQNNNRGISDMFLKISEKVDGETDEGPRHFKRRVSGLSTVAGQPMENIRVTALVTTPDGTSYQINTRVDGTIWARATYPQDEKESDIVEENKYFVLSPEEMQKEENKVLSDALGEKKSNEKDDTNKGPRADSANSIDIMLAYTQEAMCEEAGFSSTCYPSATNKQPIEDLIETGVAMNNDAFDNSLINTELNIVLIHNIVSSYNEPADQDTILSDAQAGNIPEVHTLRNEYCADLVAIISTLGSGLGYIYSSASWAYTQTNKNYISGRTLSHEIGHNFGCYHNREDSGTFHFFAHGYRDPDENFRTIMAYGCDSSSCPRINYYSNISTTYGGDAVGNLTHMCALMISGRRSTVANFRQSCPGPAPTPAPNFIMHPTIPIAPIHPSPPVKPVIPTQPTFPFPSIPTTPITIHPALIAGPSPIINPNPIKPVVIKPTSPIIGSTPTFPSFNLDYKSICEDNKSDWKDDFGTGCDWYAFNDPGCVVFGDMVNADGFRANDVCCVCGGGRRESESTSSDVNAVNGLKN